MKYLPWLSLFLLAAPVTSAQTVIDKKPDSTETVKQLQEITIKGGTPAFSSENGRLKVGVADNTFFKSSANLLDVFRKLPGLQVSADGTILMGNRNVPTLFVDGKPVNLSPDEVQVYLAGLSPDMVASVELITQPSAKYDGQYQGIIDLRLKKSQFLGLKGTYNLRYQQNKESLLDNTIALNHKAEHFAYGLNLGNTTGSSYYKYGALQYLNNGNAMSTDTRTITSNSNVNAQARVAYEPDKGQSLEFFLRTYQINRNAVTGTRLLTQDNERNITLSAINSLNNALPKQHNYGAGLNYDGFFKSSELHIVTSFARIDNRQTEDIKIKDLPQEALLDYWKTTSGNAILIRAAQVDYTQNLAPGKFEFGLKYANTTTKNDLRYDILKNEIFVPDASRSNQFQYGERIKAAYVSFLGTWDKLNYSASLRTEYTSTLANSITASTTTKRNYLKWLPSVAFTYSFEADEQLTLSFTSRLMRPTFDALNPFRFYFSPRNYWIGNPYLLPSKTNKLTLSFSKKALTIAINAGREQDPMARYPEYDPLTNELIYLGANLPYRDFADLQANAPIIVSKWWRINTNVGVFYNRELRPYFGQTFQIPIINYTVNGSQVFSLAKWILDVGYSFESKSGNGLYINAPVFMTDLGIQRSVFKNKLSAKLNFYDVFAGGKRRFIFREKTIINNDFTHYWGSNRLVLSLTYNFGSSTYKAREVRKNDEESRVIR